MDPKIPDPANISSPSFSPSSSYPSTAIPPPVNPPPSNSPPVIPALGNDSPKSFQPGIPSPANPAQIPSSSAATQIPVPTPPVTPSTYTETTKFPPSPFPYSDQTIAQDLSASNVVGQAVTVTDNNLSVREKIPLMKISLLLIFIITGFSGSFLYFRFTSATPAINTAMLTKPTATVSAQKTSVIIAPTESESTANPFASPTTAYINPFAPTLTPVYQNPFDEAGGNETGDNQTYQNPFENLK